MEQLDRITQQPGVMGGKACIRGMRVSVGMVVGQIGAGRSIEEVLADYPYLEREDVLQALRYAGRQEEKQARLSGLGSPAAGRRLSEAGRVSFHPTPGSAALARRFTWGYSTSSLRD